ncbi:MAG: HD domain-containing phosphohydrolase [Armatimonadota bacterium]
MTDRPSKAHILGALSQALDLVEGQPEGHALRTAKLALRIASELKLCETDKEDLYFAAVLKDSGCSNNAVRIQKMFGGDEFLAKQKVKLVDWTSNIESIKFAIAQTEAGNTVGAKLRRLAQNLGHPTKVMDEVTEARCTRGAMIAKMLGLNSEVAAAIQALDEHWDGHGSPYKLEGKSIPLLARILCFCQTFEVFFQSFGLNAAYEMAAERNQKWFDPEVVRACRAISTDLRFWSSFDDLGELQSQVAEYQEAAIDADIDGIAEAFALIIDAKSSFTAEHSTRVARYAVQLGRHMDLSPETVKLLHRAGLLHDIGKLGISTAILEKPGKLEPEEFDQIKLHPKYSDLILRRIPTFEAIADLASTHHERIDGKGYWRGLGAEQLSLASRIMTVSDVFDALSANRPYREALPLETIFRIMDRDAGTAFDPDCIASLKEIYAGYETSLPIAA